MDAKTLIKWLETLPPDTDIYFVDEGDEMYYALKDFRVDDDGDYCITGDYYITGDLT